MGFHTKGYHSLASHSSHFPGKTITWNTSTNGYGQNNDLIRERPLCSQEEETFLFS